MPQTAMKSSTLDWMHGEAGEDNVLEIRIIVVVEALVGEAEKGPQRLLAEFQRVKRQWVTPCPSFDGVYIGPEGSLKVPWGPQVLYNPRAW
jgi:hypothetical protein